MKRGTIKGKETVNVLKKVKRKVQRMHLIELELSKFQKLILLRAAELYGYSTLNAYIITTLVRESIKTINEYSSLIEKLKTQEAFFEALESSPKSKRKV